MLINQADSTILEDAKLESVEIQYWVDMKESLDRLRKNDDFLKLINQGYFKDKAINAVSMLATDHVRANGTRPELMEALVAISQLEDYFKVIDSLGTVENYSEDEE